MLIPPTSYQGAKQRIASKIIDIIKPNGQKFYDLCCGSGAVSLELINRGYDPKKIVMVDLSPWGLFWAKIAKEEFKLEKLRDPIDAFPTDLNLYQQHILSLSKEPISENWWKEKEDDLVYKYLIIQASSFGGKAIWIKNNKWQNISIRNYWQPTETSNRRSPVNPMTPMPETLYKRTKEIVDKLSGKINAFQVDAACLEPEDDVIIYIDPPYKNTTKYGHDFDYMEYVNSISNKCYVSEGVILGEKYHEIESTRKKGGISGGRKSFNREYLSEFN